MTSMQMRRLDLAEGPRARVTLDRIRNESREQSERGRWFEGQRPTRHGMRYGQDVGPAVQGGLATTVGRGARLVNYYSN